MKEQDLKDTLTRMAAAARGINDDAKRAADQAHRERIHAEIEEDMDKENFLVCDSNEEAEIDAASIIDAIAAGRIRHLTITY